jgi:transposase
MKRVSTIAAKPIEKISRQKLAIGLDLGDRNSWYCVLEESGQIQREQRVRTNVKTLQEVIGTMPHSRVALEIGTHSPWISRLLSELGHEVIVANARKVRLIGESRKKDDRLDAQTLARLARIDPELLSPVKHRSARAQADLMMIRARAGLVRARTALVNTARGLAKSYGERLRGCNVRNLNREKAEGLSPELQAALEPLLNAIESLSERIVEYNEGIENLAQQSYPQVTLLKQVKGVGTLIALTFLLTLEDPHRFGKEPRCGRLSRAAAGTEKLRTQRTADAHQQGRRSLLANAAGTGSATHSGTVRGGLRSQALGAEVGRARRQKREEASHRGHCEKAGGVAASPVGEWRSVRTDAQQQPNDSSRSRVKTKTVPGREKTKAQSRVPVTALIAWPRFDSSRVELQGAKQMAAPAEPRTPNLHRAKIAHEECGWKGGDSGDSAAEKACATKKQKNPLTPTGLLMEGDSTH